MLWLFSEIYTTVSGKCELFFGILNFDHILNNRQVSFISKYIRKKLSNSGWQQQRRTPSRVDAFVLVFAVGTKTNDGFVKRTRFVVQRMFSNDSMIINAVGNIFRIWKDFKFVEVNFCFRYLSWMTDGVNGKDEPLQKTYCINI